MFYARKKLLLILLLTILLGGCGFTPLYKDSSQTAAMWIFNNIHIANIPDQEGQYLRNQLIDHFYSNGRPANAKYTLTISPIQETLTDLDITKNSDATRAQLKLKTKMELSDNHTGTILSSRRLTAITSFNILQSQFTTRVSENSARESALNELARQTERYIALYAKRQP